MTEKIKAAVLTTGRQDYGVLRSTLHLLAEDSRFELLLFAGGMHLSKQYGYTISKILEDGQIPVEQLSWLGDCEQGNDIHEQMGLVTKLVGNAFLKHQPDFLLMVGDRYETAAAAIAAVAARIPIVHLHGGEETEGAIDNLYRHAITKMSHLHLVSHPIHANRVIQMGENPEMVHIVGAPGLDNLHRPDLYSKEQLEEALKVELTSPIVIITLHPVTNFPEETIQCLNSLIKVMEKIEATYIITLPNADPGNEIIRETFINWSNKHSRTTAVEAMGEKAYFGLMKEANLMVGNSSSGLIEAAIFQLPVINIGRRQQGRLRGKNVIDTNPSSQSILHSFELGLSSDFRESLKGASSPYGDGKSSQKIVEILLQVNFKDMTPKKFCEAKVEI